MADAEALFADRPEPGAPGMAGFQSGGAAGSLDPLLQLSAIELARRIRSREATSAEVVERHIARIQQVNPGLNAVVRDRFEQARAEARRADEQVARGEGGLPPLCGVPCTIKESIALGGMPNTSGLLARAGVVADSDATAVARLRAAGAIPLGVTNVPEITMWTATFNKVYGRTRNAYRPDRIAGGSSGGEGAIVGAGGSPFGLGTDVGGSIRIPAFCNGVFGHKPSGGLVPATGQYPEFSGAILRKNTTGPLARRAEDLMPLLKILAGPDGRDEGCRSMPLLDVEDLDVAALRVVQVEGAATRARIQPELLRALQGAAKALGRRGADVETRPIPELRGAMSMTLCTMLEGDGMQLDLAMGNGEPVSLVRELARFAVRRSDHTYPALLGTCAMALARRRGEWVRRGADRARALREKLEALLRSDGVLLFPTSLGTAPPHGLRTASYFRFTGIFNAIELPVTQVPLGLDSQGLPLGVQVVAAHGRDHLTIAVALELERAFGGWVPPAEGAGR